MFMTIGIILNVCVCSPIKQVIQYCANLVENELKIVTTFRFLFWNPLEVNMDPNIAKYQIPNDYGYDDQSHVSNIDFFFYFYFFLVYLFNTFFTNKNNTRKHHEQTF